MSTLKFVCSHECLWGYYESLAGVHVGTVGDTYRERLGVLVHASRTSPSSTLPHVSQ